jgi:uncharacterized protein (UPF0276 family)
VTESALPLCGLSLMPEGNWLEAALPLFEAGDVEALEWSFDTCWDNPNLPEWLVELTSFFSNRDCLLGHGVSLSLLSVENRYADNWLRKFDKLCADYTFSHVSEHFGFMRTRNFHFGSPLPVPYDSRLVEIAQSRLEAMGRISNCPVGVENLALSFSRADVERHACYIDEIVEPIGGFILLDLHNLYCQACNFNLTLEELFALYPAERVRELHVSGGSWTEAAQSKPRQLRRDTHDNAVPFEIIQFLPRAIAALPNLRAIIFEQLGTSLDDSASRIQFREDFAAIKRLVEEQRCGITC